MVTQALSLTRSGLSDFIVQRVTAVIIALYTLCIIGFFMMTEVDHAALTDFFGRFSMQLFSTVALLSIVAHAWIGMWTIGTDYLRPAHLPGLATSIRFAYQLICLGALFVYVFWALGIIWQF